MQLKKYNGTKSPELSTTDVTSQEAECESRWKKKDDNLCSIINESAYRFSDP